MSDQKLSTDDTLIRVEHFIAGLRAEEIPLHPMFEYAESLSNEVKRLRALINNPHTSDFMEAVKAYDEIRRSLPHPPRTGKDET